MKITTVAAIAYHTVTFLAMVLIYALYFEMVMDYSIDPALAFLFGLWVFVGVFSVMVVLDNDFEDWRRERRRFEQAKAVK
jgi:hypothetical protein